VGAIFSSSSGVANLGGSAEKDLGNHTTRLTGFQYFAKMLLTITNTIHIITKPKPLNIVATKNVDADSTVILSPKYKIKNDYTKKKRGCKAPLVKIKLMI
jgi:hypothetical protein